MNNSTIILFDGICNFCNDSVNFVIKRDKKSIIKFAALQSETGQRLLTQYKLPTELFDTFVLIEAGMVYTKSTAALKVCRYLTPLWRLLYGFIIVPKFIRDGIYQLISKNRYAWFGKRNACMIPSPEVRSRFLT